MAFGVHPKYIQKIPFSNNLSDTEALASAIIVARKIGWEISTIASNGFKALAFNSITNTFEEITLTVEFSWFEVMSCSLQNPISDDNRNKENVIKFFIYLSNYSTDLDYSELERTLGEMAISQDKELVIPSFPKKKIKFSTGLRSFFIPQQNYFITPILILLNAFIFLMMIFSGYNPFIPNMEFLVSWGANFRPVTSDGEWWRLITCVFLHLNVVHLGFNMLALAYVGVYLEPILGRVRFVVAYLLTGFSASILSLWWNDFTVSIGASGAVFGMFGVFLALLFTDLIEPKTRKQMLISIAVFVSVNVLSGFAKMGVDNAAHVGGLIGGAILGFSFFPSLRDKGNISIKYLTIVLVSVFFFLSTAFVYNQIPNDIPEYDKLINEVLADEQVALLPENFENNLSKEQIVRKIDYSMTYWEKAIKKLRQADQLEIPPLLHERNRFQIDFYFLEMDLYPLIKKKFIENTSEYDEKIDNIVQKQDSIRTEIQKINGE
jgi:rhomboid protease GluP